MTKKVDVLNVSFGSKKIIIIAGPCAVESKEEYELDIKNLKKVDVYRGGAFKARTSPYSFLGLGVEGLKILNDTSKRHNKPVISEITSTNQLEDFEKYIDIIQVGARNMQNFELLKALGKTNKAILLKRGFGNTVEELLDATKYISKEGNDNIILCERGIRTFENSTRFTLDISAIAVLKEKCDYPIIVDPSHAAGTSKYVESLALAAIAAGADGIMVEAHSNPEQALSDKEQALTIDEFNNLVEKIEKVANAVGRYV